VNARKISENELWDYYYDAMELIDSSNLPEAEKLLGKALVLDPGFVAAHVGMVALYQAAGYDEGVRKFTESSYLETTKRFRKWPDDLTWGISENRQYLRAMCYKATQHQVDGENEEAEKLYCLSFRLSLYLPMTMTHQNEAVSVGKLLPPMLSLTL
jgi:tetratricopeptide (TPR) repeat protein